MNFSITSKAGAFRLGTKSSGNMLRSPRTGLKTQEIKPLDSANPIETMTPRSELSSDTVHRSSKKNRFETRDSASGADCQGVAS